MNRFGSTFVLSDDTGAMVTKRYFNSRDLSDVEVTEINPSGVSAESISVQVVKGTNNSALAYGRDYTFASAGNQNGWPALTASGEDITLTRDDLVGGDYRITLKESAIEQGIHVVAYDAAGNEANVDSANIFINSDPIARWVHNTALFVVSILIMVASLGVGDWAAYRRFAK